MEQINFYQMVTNKAEQAIVKLTLESRGKLDEDNQSHWDMANGVVRLWRDVAGAAILEEDVERLERLLEVMPHADLRGDDIDDPGSGDWHLTAVMYLP